MRAAARTRLVFEGGDVGQVAAPLAVVQAVANDKLVGDVKPDEIGARRRGAWWRVR